MKGRDRAFNGGGSGIVTRHGRVVLRWGDPEQTYDLKSSTKAIGVTAVGVALLDGKFKSLHDPAKLYQPAVGLPARDERGQRISRQDHPVPPGDADRRLRQEWRLHGTALRAGAKWSYSDGGPNWLAECVTLVYGRDLQELMFERVFSPIGIGRDDLKMACELLPAQGDQRPPAARVRLRHQRQRRGDGPDRLPVSPWRPMARAADPPKLVRRCGADGSLRNQGVARHSAGDL